MTVLELWETSDPAFLALGNQKASQDRADPLEELFLLAEELVEGRLA
jgi:hypothetical protein